MGLWKHKPASWITIEHDQLELGFLGEFATFEDPATKIRGTLGRIKGRFLQREWVALSYVCTARTFVFVRTAHTF